MEKMYHLNHSKQYMHLVRTHRAKQARRTGLQVCVDCPICSTPSSIPDAKRIGKSIHFICKNCDTRFRVNSDRGAQYMHSVRTHRAKQARRTGEKTCIDCPICATPSSIPDAKDAGEWRQFICKNCDTRFRVNLKDMMSDYACALRA